MTDGGLASLPALSALTHLQLEADEASDISLAGLWAVSQLPQLRHLSWSVHDDLPPLVTQPPTPGLPSGQLPASSSFLGSSGSAQGLLTSSSQGLAGSAPLLQHLAALQQLRQLHLVVDEPTPGAAAEAAAAASAVARSSHSSGHGRNAGAATAAGGSARSSGDGNGGGVAPHPSGTAATTAATAAGSSESAPGDESAQEVPVDPGPSRLEMQAAWQEALAGVLPMCEVVVGFTDQLVLDEPQDVWGDLQE